MTTELVKYEAARAALAAAHRVDEVKNIRDKAEAMAAYARQAKDTDLIQKATEIKVRAERRCGELLRATAANGQRATKTSGPPRHVSNDATHAATLAGMGLTRDESSRYQRLADMPAEHFEAAVETAKATAGEVTSAHMLRMAKLLQENAAMRADMASREAKGKARASEVEARTWYGLECAMERLVQATAKAASTAVPPCDPLRAKRLLDMWRTTSEFLSTYLGE